MFKTAGFTGIGPTHMNVVARQQLKPVYHRNGAAYAISRECLLQQGSIKGRRTGYVVIDEPMISIDTLWDVNLVEFVLRDGGRSL